MSMSQSPPPPPSPGGHQPGNRWWKLTIILTAVLAVVLSGTIYLLLDRRVDDLEQDLDATREQLEDEQSDGLLSQLTELLELLGLNELGNLDNLESLEDLDDLEGLEGLEDLESLEDLLGTGSGIDPILFECLSAGGLGNRLGGTSAIPDADLETQVTAMQDIIAQERGLAVTDDADIDFVSVDEVRRRAVERVEQELDAGRAAARSRMLAALGAVEPGFDLAQAQLDALESGVAGFYDSDTGQLVIGAQELDGIGVYVTTHELVHAAADDTFGLPDTAALEESAGADAAYAALSAVEGDASLYGQMFVSAHLPIDQLLSLQGESASSNEDLAALPHIIRRDLEFPYLEGMVFSCDLFLQGGWEAVDASYTDPPTTSAQILFPERYRAGEAAADVRDPAEPDGWEQLYTDTFGAADLLFLLEAPGGTPDHALDEPVERVRAWAGGEVTVWDRDGDTAVALILAERDEGSPLCQTVVDYYTLTFPEAQQHRNGSEFTFDGSEQSAVMNCLEGEEVALGIGPDVDTARAAIS